MSKQLSIAANSSFLMLGKLSQRFLSFFTVIFLARYLGPEQYGALIYVISFITLAALFWNFGVNTLVTRSISRDISVQGQYLGGGVIVKGVLFFICFPLILLYFYFAESNQIFYSALLFASGSFLGNIAGVFNAMFAARRRMDYSALINVVRSAVLLLAVYMVSFLPKSLPLVFCCYSLSFLAILLLVLFLSSRSFCMPDFRVKPLFIFQIIRRSVPFFLTSATSIFLFRIDHVMLSKISGNIELGMYGAAYTLFEVVISLFPMMFMSSAFPVLAKLYTDKSAALQRLYSLLFKYFIWLSLPMSVGLAVLGKQMCLTLYGLDYLPAGYMLALLGGGIWIFFLSTLISWVLTACDKQNTVLLSNTVAVVLNIALNFVFIPRFEGYGAAGVTLVCELFNFVFMFIVLRQSVPVPSLGTGFYAKVLLALVVMTVPLVLFVRKMVILQGSFLLVSSVALGIALYGASSLLLRIGSLEELRLLRKRW